MNIKLEKEKLRKKVLEELRGQSAERRREKSDEIIKKIRSSVGFDIIKTIMFYVPTFFEVDTMPLMKDVLMEGRKVTIPYVDGKSGSLLSVQIHNADEDLVCGTYGIQEPRRELIEAFDLNKLDLILVPGVAFDRKQNRLGRGKGYYDRFLKILPARVKKIGLGFDFQLFDEIPLEEWDIPIDQVITNDGEL